MIFYCRIEKPLDLSGSLEINHLLDNTEALFKGQVHGPEVLLKRDNEIFATVLGGQIIKISGNHISHVAKIGKACGKYKSYSVQGLRSKVIVLFSVLDNIRDFRTCGRPLGLDFDNIPNHLIVADAYYGIWQVNINDGKKLQLVSPEEIIDGKVKNILLNMSFQK